MLPLILIAALLLGNSWASAYNVQSENIAEENSKKPADQFSSEVASAWFELLYDIVKAERTAPPQASRIYGLTAVALYESIVFGTENNLSLVGQLNGLTSLPDISRSRNLHWPTVASTAIADTVRGLYPAISQESLNAINNLEQRFETQNRAEVSKRKYRRSVSHGRAVAAGILAWAATDGFSINNNCTYVAKAVPGAWKPTPPAFNPNPLQPCWGMLRPMVLSSGEECPAVGHPPFSTDANSAFYASAREVYEVGVSLTAEQKTIADYWADNAGATGTPPGHWIAIVSQIARNDRLSLARAAEAYTRVGIAVHDAFINCWDEKYDYNLQRPVTFINENIDPSWQPYIATPNFPTYTSGHSTQSGAAAGALTDMFGVKRFTDTTHTDHNLSPPQQPRTFNSFEEAAREAAVSRLYGGIHYVFDNDDGLGCGQCVAQKIRERVAFRADD
jgi:PAP2 superfamily